MAAGNTYTQIASTTLGSASASVTFSSIPATYTDLVIVVQTSSSATNVDLRIQFNSDTATNYSDTHLVGTSSASSSRNTNLTALAVDNTGTGGSPSATPDILYLINVFNYANTTTFKTSLFRYNSITGTVVEAGVGLWRATPAAINTIKLFFTTGNLVSGSTFNLYGITAA
jgi:hypothetical protein